MKLRPYKYIVQAVVQELDDDGNVVGEQVTEQTVLYTPDKFQEWVDQVMVQCEEKT